MDRGSCGHGLGGGCIRSWIGGHVITDWVGDASSMYVGRDHLITDWVVDANIRSWI